MSETRPDARDAALYVLSRCRRFDAWSQQTVQAAREKYSLDGRDAALCARLCLSVLRNAALCDFYIDWYAAVPGGKMEPQVRDVLRLGVCQILFFDRIPAPAAVDRAVEQTKRTAPRAAGMVNAVLRRIAENRAALPPIPGEGTARELSVRFSHPLWLCERLVGERGYAFAKEFLAASNRPAALTLSVNLCRTDAVSLVKKLSAAGFPARVSALSPVSVEVEASGAVTELPGFAEGEFFVQDAAAALAVVSAAPSAGMRVLDACAAPGGKSFLCASLMGDEGEILSCDLHAKKLDRVEQSAARLGFSCIRTAPMDAASPRETLKDSFDLVLADVPCSGFGVIRRKPEIRYKDPSALRRLPEVQLRLLRGAASCVRKGGALVYSTCTVLPEENGGVVDAFLSENGAFAREEERTVWPQEAGTDGFYYCRMKRYDDDRG